MRVACVGSRRFSVVALSIFAGAVSIGEGVSLVALALVTLCWLIGERGPLPRVDWPPWAPVFGVVIWLVAGACAWGLGGYGLLDPGEVGRWCTLLTLAVVTLSLRHVDDRDCERIATIYLAVLVLASLFALATVVGNARPGEWLVRGASNGIDQGRMPFDAAQTVAGGFYFHRLKFAHVAAIGVLVLTVRQLVVEMTWRRRFLEVLALVTVTTAFFLTYVRASVLGVVGGLAVVGFLAGARSRALLGGGALVVAGAAALTPTLRERMATLLASQATDERSLIWSQAIRIISDHPFGVGMGNYPTVVGNYYDLVDATFPTRTYAHSLWLTAWAETGPLGLCGFIGGFAALAWWAKEGRVEVHALSIVAIVVSFMVTGLAHDVFYDPPVALSYAGVLGFLAVRAWSRTNPAHGGETQAQAKGHADQGAKGDVSGVMSAQMNARPHHRECRSAGENA